MSATEFQFTDRYQEMGVPYPDTETMCEGQCEGTGFYPQFLAGPWLKAGALRLENDPEELITEGEIKAWHQAHMESSHETSQTKPYIKVCDGWHFIQCSDCKGSGKRCVSTQPEDDRQATI